MHTLAFPEPLGLSNFFNLEVHLSTLCHVNLASSSRFPKHVLCDLGVVGCFFLQILACNPGVYNSEMLMSHEHNADMRKITIIPDKYFGQ